VFGEHRLSWEALLGLLGIAAALLAAYGVHARRVRNPLLSLSLFTGRTFRISVAGGFVTRLGVGGMPFLLPLLYQIGLGYAPWQAGLLTMPQAAAAILMRGLNRPILRLLGHRRTLILNTILLGCSMAGFVIIAPGASPVTLMMLGFVLGFLSSLQFTSINTLVFADLDDRDVSRAGSISSAAQQLSLSFGVAIASLVVSAFLDRSSVVSSIHKAFVMLAGLTLLSSAWFAGLRPTDGANVSRFSEAGD
jgi:Na+/melibiose symporter-like transporter